MATITRDNFKTAGTLLTRSTAARGATPNGNVYFDLAADEIQLIDVSELATTSAEANGLNVTDKVQALALYFFILQEVEADTALQDYKVFMDSVPNRMGKLVGATAFLNGIKLVSADKLKIADSGFTEFDVAGNGSSTINAIYHGVKSSNPINSSSQPFYQLVAKPVTEAARQAVAPIDFGKTGFINEVIQTEGDTNNGNFDSKLYELIIGVREFGYSMEEVSSTGAGVTELGAYNQGYGIGNAVVNELSSFSLADVYGGAAIAPFNGISFTRNAVATTQTGFTEGDGVFTDTLANTGAASLIQVRAWLDAAMNDDSDIDAGAGSFMPKRAEPLYTIDVNGNLVTRPGFYIANLPAADQQNVIFTADDDTTRTYPFNVGLVIKLSSDWYDDTAQFFRLMYLDGALAADFNTSGAVTATDASSVPIAGDITDNRVSADSSDYVLNISYAYDGNSEAGLAAGVDKLMALRIGGGTTSKARTFYFTITRSASISVDASTDGETN